MESWLSFDPDLTAETDGGMGIVHIETKGAISEGLENDVKRILISP